MNDYKPTSFPATLGAVAVALTALTIGLAVVLPARIDSGDRASLPVAATPESSAPTQEAVAERIRVEVVAVRPAATREPWLPVEARAATARRTAPAANAQRSSVSRVAAPERVGYHGAAAPSRCPYLINGTVAATS